MAKKKTSNKKLLKAKAWKLYSEYIRRLKADDNSFATCVTCGKMSHWKEMQAGHAVGGRTNAILFHDDLVWPQCSGCNIFLHGNYNKYALFMIDKFGREKFEHFLNLKHKVVKISEYEYHEMISKYSAAIKQWNEDKWRI